MKTLLILRHAKSSWKHTDRRDFDRPLNTRGKRDAPRIGTHLRTENLMPDLILTSAARRTRKTAKKVAKRCGYTQKIEKLDQLYDATLGTYLHTLSRLPNRVERPLVIGHNPTLEQLVYHLTNRNEIMPTAALAQVHLPIQRWKDLDSHTEGTLIALWTPKTLPGH